MFGIRSDYFKSLMIAATTTTITAPLVAKLVIIRVRIQPVPFESILFSNEEL